MRNHLPPISNSHRKHTNQLDVPLRTLLGSGPSNIPARVLQAAGTQIIGQQDAAFRSVKAEVQELLRYVWQTDNEHTFAIAGSEEGALEAAVASVLKPGDVLLVGQSGGLSERIGRVAEGYGVQVKWLKPQNGHTVDIGEIEAALDTLHPAAVALVHGELTTGAQQPIAGVGDLCRKYDALLMVDTIGSLGAVPVYVDAWGIDICYSSADKCLSAVSGLSLLTIGERALNRMAQRQPDYPIPTQYLHVERLSNLWRADSQADEVLPVNLLYALREALRVLAEEGLVECWQRHRNNAELLWFGLGDLHLESPVALEQRLPSLTTVRIPSRINSSAIKRHLLTHYNIEVGSSPLHNDDTIWRIGLMGHNSRAENVTLLLRALEDALRIVR